MMNRNRLRAGCLAMFAGAATLLSACGGSDPAPAPGSPERPLVAHTQTAPSKGGRSNESSSPTANRAPAGAGYDKLLKNQARHPRRRFTPCNLVTVSQARAIVGSPMQEPVEAPQGPTCVYRSRDGRSFVTVAVQRLDLQKLKPRVRLRHRVAVATRTGVCGTLGQPVLYVPLSRGRVLSVAGQCDVARRFATKAVQQLSPAGR